MSQHSLRLSPLSGNYPQIAYGGDHLYYAFQDAGGWHTETADAAWSVGSGAALALDAGGKAHISYYDAANSDLKYATNKSGAWVSQTVVSAGNVGLYSDIAIDLWGDPAIVYFNATTSELHYIYYDSDYGGWGPDADRSSSDGSGPHRLVFTGVGYQRDAQPPACQLLRARQQRQGIPGVGALQRQLSLDP